MSKQNLFLTNLELLHKHFEEFSSTIKYNERWTLKIEYILLSKINNNSNLSLIKRNWFTLI